MKKLVLALLLIASSLVQAQVKFIIPSGPGSGSDQTVNIYSECFEKLNITTSKEFKPGGGGLVAINALRSSQDTNKTITVLVGSLGLHMLSNFPGVNAMEDIKPLTYLNSITMVLVARPGRIETISDLQELAKTRPINAGSHTAVSDFLYEVLFKELNIPYQVVPYKANTNMLTDLVHGDLDIVSDTYPGAKSMIETGKVKIVVSTLDRTRAAKLGHESINNHSKLLPRIPLGIILSTNNDAASGMRTLVADSVKKCNADDSVITKLKAIDSPPLNIGYDEIRDIYKLVSTRK